MNGTEFVAATAAILFAAFLTGWFAHWLISRLTRTTRPPSTRSWLACSRRSMASLAVSVTVTFALCQPAGVGRRGRGPCVG